MKLKYQILILCLASLAFLTFFIYAAIYLNLNATYKQRIENLKEDLLNNKKKFLHDLVSFAHEITKESYKDFSAKKKNLTDKDKIKIIENDFKEKAKSFLAALRYDDGNGYFFAYELRPDDIYYAFHGTKKENWNTVPVPFDRHAFLYRKEIINKAKQGGGYVIYVEEKPSTARLTQTIAYAEYFKEWNWVIVSSIFTDDIDKEVEILKTELKTEQKKALLLFLTVLAIFTFFVYILIIIASNSITKPLEDISDHALEISKEGKLSMINIKRKINEKTEMGKLVSSLNKMTVTLIEAEKNLKEQERLEKEMEIAERIQTAILTTPEPFRDLEIAADMRPAEEVGGDYYDIIVDKHKNLWLAIGDVSGHGITPGLIMMMSQSSFSTMIHENENISPKEAILAVNYLLCQNIRERMDENYYMTMTFLKYLGNGDFVYSGYHLDIIIYRSTTKKCELHKTSGVFLGVMSDISKNTKNSTFTLNKGDIMLLYTDGIPESLKADNDSVFFGVGNLQKVLQKCANMPLKNIINNIFKITLEWSGNIQKDDMTLLVVRKK